MPDVEMQIVQRMMEGEVQFDIDKGQRHQPADGCR